MAGTPHEPAGAERPRVRIVTGYVPLPGHPRTQATYLELGGRLLALPVPKVVWTTEELRPVLAQMASASASTQVLAWRERFWMLEEIAGRGVTVAALDPRKDTLGFHAVGHQKTRWLEEAARVAPADILVWLDFALFHVPGVSEALVLDFVARLREDAVALPGCWSRSPTVRLDRPDWRFCGGVLVCPERFASPLQRECREAFRATVERHARVVWEVNTWAQIEARGRLPLRQYHAVTHDGRMLSAYESPPSP